MLLAYTVLTLFVDVDFASKLYIRQMVDFPISVFSIAYIFALIFYNLTTHLMKK